MNQIEAGIEQFEWAIKLYLNENAYVPAITLAGASEGIFGELIQGSAIKELRQRLLQNTGLEDISKQLNKPKNWLKHGSCKENYSSIDDDELQAMAISRILVLAIHQTNAQAKANDGRLLLAVLSERDELVERHKILTSAIASTQKEPDRYSTREIKWGKVIPVSALQKQADDISAKLRDLNVLIQASNWQIDLLNN